MESSEDVLEVIENQKVEKVHQLPFTQFIEQGVDIEEHVPKDIFNYPASCKFKHCKAILIDEKQLLSH